MKNKNILMLLLLCFPMALLAQGEKQGLNQGERMFEIIVREDTSMTNTRGIKWEDNNRRLLTTDLYNLYRSTIAGKITTASTGIISAGINFIYNKIASHRQDWMQAVQKECTYTKQLSMQTEIVDFYKQPSTKGAMDPANIVFDGFGCRQTIGDNNSGGIQGEMSSKGNAQGGLLSNGDSQGGAQRGMSLEVKPQELKQANVSKSDNVSKDVFYIYCSLRTDSIGKQRITNHSKFEVVVDSIYFNPYICNLPNDSTAASQGDHIYFDFAKRSNLTFNLTANVTSSWMNEAIQIYRDVPLGEFKITAKIDEKDVVDSVFTYSRRLDKGTRKESNISVTGDCFIVPRSYVGTLDGTAFTSAWGTGQYKIDMQVSESCSINRDFYLEKQEEQQANKQTANTENKGTKNTKKQKEEWNDNWKEEWNIIKKRQKSKSLWDNFYEVVKTEWTGKEWVTMIIEPALTTFATSGANLIYETQTMGGGSTGGNTNGGTAGAVLP